MVPWALGHGRPGRWASPWACVTGDRLSGRALLLSEPTKAALCCSFTNSMCHWVGGPRTQTPCCQSTLNEPRDTPPLQTRSF